MMLNLELFAQGSDHSVVKVCTIVSDDPFGETGIGETSSTGIGETGVLSNRIFLLSIKH